jgi:glycosyltransferase involved in cell wall biosynthesis
LNEAVRPFVVVPCLNEALAIRGLLEGVLAHCRDVIVIDDGSTDDTAGIVARLPVTLIRHPARRGKGEALRAGFREALKRGADGVLTMDGDGQHDPADIPRILAAARRFPGAMVIGARMLQRERQPAGRRRANDFADWGISWGCGRPVADTQSGQRWYPRAAVELVDLPAQDFVFEAAILIAASRDLDMPVVSIPIACRYDDSARRSHFRPVRDVVRITLFTIGRVAHYGHMLQSYRASHGTPPRVHDPERLLAMPPVARLARAVGPPGNGC